MAEFFTAEHFRSFFELFSDPVWVVNRDLRLVYLNPAAMAKFGCKADNALGKRCLQALFENHGRCPFCSFEEVFAGREARVSNFTLLDTDGRNHVYALSHYPCAGYLGVVDYVVAVCLDKTEAADLFSEISRLQGLAAMGEYSAELSHEIRNPLNSIAIQMSLLQKMAGRLDSETAASFLRVVEVVRAESDRLNTLAGDFLKMQKSRCLRLEDCNPFVEVAGVAELLAEEARRVRIDIRLSFEGEGPCLRADRDKLRQAFMNLMKNAVEALSESETADAFLEIKGYYDGRLVSLSFADNGPGIPFSRQARIFDLFYTTKTCGTGIGLHLCRDIIRAHDGEISFVSDDQGTVFKVVLPVGANP